MRELGERANGKRRKKQIKVKNRKWKQKPVLNPPAQRDKLDKRKRTSFVLDKSLKGVASGQRGEGGGRKEGRGGSGGGQGSIEGKL